MRAGEVHLPERTTLTMGVNKDWSEEAEELVVMLLDLTKSEKVLWKYKPTGKASLTVGLASFEFDPRAGTIWVWVVQGGDLIKLTPVGRNRISETLDYLIQRGLDEERAESEERSKKAVIAALHIVGETRHSDD